MHYLEKQAYEREMQVLQKKLDDLQKILDDKDQVPFPQAFGSTLKIYRLQQIRNMPKSFFGGDSVNSKASSGSGTSSFYATVIDNKDMEIKRLTQIVFSSRYRWLYGSCQVKNLTENLKDTQETKYRLKKYQNKD